MINAVRGKALEINPNSIVVLSDGGLEYFVEISTNCSAYYASMSTEERKSVRVLTVLQHREDAMTLFGFYDETERYIFNQLQTVPGIGARGALKILSGITVEKLILALDQQDVKTLSKVPGIGSKTAQKLILQLRNVLIIEETKEDKEKPSKSKDRFSDLIASFIEMGYDRKAVVKAIDEVLEENSLIFASLDDRKIEEKIFPLVLRRIS